MPQTLVYSKQIEDSREESTNIFNILLKKGIFLVDTMQLEPQTKAKYARTNWPFSTTRVSHHIERSQNRTNTDSNTADATFCSIIEVEGPGLISKTLENQGYKLIYS
jgi:hypothetical protein